MTQFPKNIALLGSTGSIGQQTLDVVRRFPEYFRIVALAARSNVSLLEQQAREFEPSLVACFADTPSVESEQSAIWQCLRGEQSKEVNRLLLTASGGPFRRATLEQIRSVTVEQALAHPTWRMGPKITVDSATLMNKGLEVLEAHWLFGIPYERIDVIVHPESIIHSMVEFVDGSIKMQASLPSMHLPIQEALSYPARLDTAGTGLVRELSWPEVARLNFEALDTARFPCFQLALEAAKRGGTYPSVLVGADEEAVALFLAGKISFPVIAELIEAVLERHQSIEQPDIPTILEATTWARRTTQEFYGKMLNVGT